MALIWPVCMSNSAANACVSLAGFRFSLQATTTRARVSLPNSFSGPQITMGRYGPRYRLGMPRLCTTARSRRRARSCQWYLTSPTNGHRCSGVMRCQSLLQ
jgi:hypothetical protein